MLDYEKALQQVLTNVAAPAPARFAIGEAFGLVLAQDVAADVDMPAFDRTAMDGFAVRSDDTIRPGAKLKNIGEASAGGEMLTKEIGPGECAAIYTGAAIPAGADAVVMVERTKTEGEFIDISVSVKKGENIRFRGEDVKKGELLLKAGATLRPQEIAVCASFGAGRILAFPRPSICILSTGDELVPPESIPKLNQIRDSNGIMIEGQALRAGAIVKDRRVVKDTQEAIETAIRDAAANCDMLLLSGGVSMGARDYVAPILQKIGFAGGFHKANIKPGKPIWFGKWKNVVAFGLPGNPVSSFVTFELFVRPAICKLRGENVVRKNFNKGIVEGGPAAAADREQFVPAVERDGNITFLPWTSSADLMELARANALARIPVGVSPTRGAAIDWIEI